MGRKTAPYTDSVWGSIFQQGKISSCLKKSLIQDEDLVTYFSALIDVHRWWTWIFKKLYTLFQHNFFLWPQKGQCCFRDYSNACPTYTYSSSSQKGSFKNLLKFYLLLCFHLHLSIMHECMVCFYLSIHPPR